MFEDASFQNQQAAILSEVITMLQECEVPYILEGGTLLGAVREGRFLPWDDDVGIAVPTEKIFGQKEKIELLLVQHGFEIGKRNESFEDYKINAIKSNTRYEILGWFLRGKYRRRCRYRMPRRFMDATATIEFLGRSYNCPASPEDYLRFFYGNWRVPKKSGRFFSIRCYDQKVFWGRQLRKLWRRNGKRRERVS